MKLPISWLKDYVEFDIDAKAFADALTMSGSMVEGIENFGTEISHVKTGKILSVEKHPNADNLVVCQVNMGEETIQIVTAAKNVAPGNIVPVALHGAKLCGGIKIKKSKLRGVESNGMFCSVSELGLTTHDYPGAVDDGILILDDQTPIGMDVKKIFDLDDDIAEFEITSNRPDCLSVIGLARETAVTLQKEFKPPVMPQETEPGEAGKMMKITVQEPQLCPRYTAKIVNNIRIAPSPAWMRNRLRACGVRPINNIVDITNYVMLEYGQPMHAFDLRFLEGNQINVRLASDGEKFTTLDDQERTLDSSMLVICDAKKPVAVAGVMGGANSEIQPDTKQILFESANFAYGSVRRTSKALGLRTEASSRYEKGLDPKMTADAVQRACELVRMLDAGDVVEGIIDVDHSPKEPVKLAFEPDRINRFLGIDVSEKYMADVLTSLGFTVGKGYVLVPSYREEIKTMADIAEEIARFYGYENIPSTLMRGESIPGVRTFAQKMEEKAKNIIASLGCYEALTYSFLSSADFDKIGLPADCDERNAVEIANPLGEETRLMRTTMIPSMLNTLALNYSHRIESVKLFEIGKVYLPTGEQLPDEPKKIAIGTYGSGDFYELKGMIETLLDKLLVKEVTFEKCSDREVFHPGRCAVVYSKGVKLGILGEVHPDVLDRYEIGTRAYLAVLDFQKVLDAVEPTVTYQKLPRFPGVSRDLAVLVDAQTPVGHLQQAICEKAGQYLENVDLFDIYTGKQVPEGKKSVAFSISFRASDRTLTDEEVNAAFDHVLQNLQEKFGAVLR